MALRTLHLFAGAGGGILADLMLGHAPVAAVEIEEYPRRILLERQRDGLLPWFPVWDDVQTFDGKEWRGKVDIVSGGFPCQDISTAGSGEGINGKRSGLWSEMARIVGEIRPRYVFVENSPVLTSRGLGRVLGDLAALGFDAEWGVVGAHHAGAPHRRDRIWILADASSPGREPRRAAGETIQGPEEVKRSGRRGGGSWWAIDPADIPDADPERLQKRGIPEIRGPNLSDPPGIGGISPDIPDPDEGRQYTRGKEYQKKNTERVSNNFTGYSPHIGHRQTDGTVEPQLGRVAHGVASRVDRLKAIGNGQVPLVAAMAWRILEKRLREE